MYIASVIQLLPEQLPELDTVLTEVRSEEKAQSCEQLCEPAGGCGYESSYCIAAPMKLALLHGRRADFAYC
jgi:hypothetical protein